MKKLLSLMLVLAMLLSLVPSFAEEGDAVVQDNPDAAAAELTAEPEEPEQPAEEPEKPAEEPEQPAEEPEKPAEEPEKPAEEPEKPAEEPEKPAEEPEKPAEEPEKPAEEPEKPAEEPEKPAEEPEKPAEEPEAAPEEDEEEDEEDEDDEEELEDNNVVSVGPVEDLAVINPKTNKLTLTWTGPSPAPDGYEICWGTTNDYSACKKKNNATTGSLSYTVTGLTCGQEYYFFVTAYCVNTNTGDPAYFGTHASVKYRLSPPAPAWETGYPHQKDNSAVTMELMWKQVSVASGYLLYEVTGGKEVQIAKITNNATLTYTQSGFTPKNALVYRIYSYKTVDGKEVKSQTPSEISVQYKVPTPTKLDAVSAGISSIKLTWKAVEGATSYVIERNDGSEFKKLADNVTTNTYTDEGLIFGKEYAYVVKAKVGKNYESSFCASAVESPRGTAPAGFSVKNTSNSKNTIKWKATEGASGYLLLCNSKKNGKGDSATGWDDFASNTLYEGPDLEYVHTGLTMGDTKFYRVAAYVEINGGKIYTPLSDVVSCVIKPGIPKITVENTTYNKQKVTWNNQGSCVKYEVCTSTSSSFSSSTTKKVTALNCTFTSLKNGTKYYYKVRSYIEKSSTEIIYGDWSDVKSLACAPAKPNVTGSLQNRNQVKITWPAISGATGFIIYAKENDGSWKQLATKKAEASATSYTYTAKGLNVGSTYVFAVSATREADGKTSTGEKGKTVQILIDLAGYVPTGLKCKAASTTSLTLSWAEMDGVSKFQVSGSSDDDTSYSLTKSVSGNSVTITGLKKGHTYKFKVRAKKTINGNTEYSAYSTEAKGTPTSLAPTSLAIKALTDKFGVKLTWKAAAEADGYKIYKAESENGPWTLVKDLGDGAAVKYTDKQDYDKTKTGKIYYYRICSYTEVLGNKHDGPYSAKVKIQIQLPKPNLTAEVTATTKVSLSWTDVGAEKYLVYRSTKADSGFELVKTVSSPTVTWTNADLTMGTTYYYKVRGSRTVGANTSYGPYSAVVSAMPTLGAPSITQLSPDGGSINVKWSAVSGAKQYQVYYHADGQDWKLGGTVDAAKTAFRVNNLTPKTKYYFRVRAVTVKNDKTVYGKYSPKKDAVTKIRKVTNLKATPMGGPKVLLTWDKTTDATSYEVWIADYDPVSETIDASSWKKVTSVTANKTSVEGLKANTSYGFKVRAVITKNGATDTGDYCTEVVGYTAPAAPTGLDATAITKNSITVKWKTVSGADGYTIRWRVKGGTWDKYNLMGSADSYKITGLTSGKEYEIQIHAFAKETSSRKLYGPFCSVYTVKTR